MLLKRLFREHPLGTVGAAILLVLVLVSVFADALAPFRFGEMNLDDRLAEPSSLHPLGTDQLGRDFLSRLIHGARLSLFVALAATTLHVVVAALIGGRRVSRRKNSIWWCSASSTRGCRCRGCWCC